MKLRRENRSFRHSRRLAAVGASGVFILIAMLGELLLHNHEDDAREERFRDSVAFSAKLRAQVESELNSLLYLSSGLGSYLVVRNNKLQPKEVNDILGVLHKSSGHIRNFGIAVGYTIRYVYPHAGNEGAIGLHYPDHPRQWPMVKRIVESGQPALAGPVDLVQGGQGLIYRVPLYIDRKYWGLLSTVIDLDSFAAVISSGIDSSQFEFSIRGRDASGRDGGMVMGDGALFDKADAFTQEIDIPGGSWVIAVRSLHGTGSGHTLLLRMLTYALAVLGAWMMYLLIRSRSDLADLAMYDQLTALPNRHLLEDRAEMAFARKRRKPEQTFALLFFDLDGFKEINDRYGHKAGDAVLRAVAERTSAIVRENDTVARWGGDEFIVLMEDIGHNALQLLIDRLRTAIEAPVQFEDKSLSIGASVGMATFPKSGGDLDQILKVADQQMYEDKQRRKAV